MARVEDRVVHRIHTEHVVHHTHTPSRVHHTHTPSRGSCGVPYAHTPNTCVYLHAHRTHVHLVMLTLRMYASVLHAHTQQEHTPGDTRTGSCGAPGAGANCLAAAPHARRGISCPAGGGGRCNAERSQSCSGDPGGKGGSGGGLRVLGPGVTVWRLRSCL